MGTGLVVIEKAVEFLAEEVVSSLIQNKVLSNSLDKKVENALANALNQVAKGNDFWKASVQIQRDEVLSILVQALSDPNELEVLNDPNYLLPKYLDTETIKSFNEQLGKDTDTYLYLKVLVHDYILKGLKYTSIHFLTKLPAEPTVVIGRDDDLQSLWTALNRSKHVMLTGFGGIGKTKLAQLLFHKYESEFDEVAWIEYKGILKQSFLNCITAQQFRESNYQNENERWNAITSILSNNGKKKLIVIDNVDNDVDQYPEQDEGLRYLTGWTETTVLLTSRLDDLNGFDKIELNNLNEEDCKKLFNHYYGKAVPNQELVGEIVELANWHTLTIELLAKGARRENLDDYYNNVKSGFEAVNREMTTEHHDGRTNIESHLKKLFDLQKRTDEDKKVLNSFAILPVNCECTMEEIGQWFGFKNADLDDVIQDGWLSYNEDREIYFMHPLVRTIVRFDFLVNEKGYKTIAPEGSVDKIMDYLKNDEKLYDIAKGHVSLQRTIDIVESVIESIDEEKRWCIPSLYNNLGYSYEQKGEYDKAQKYYIWASIICEMVFGKEHYYTANTYNNIGMTCLRLGDYGTALEYFFKDLAIQERIHGKNHCDTAMSYNNIGGVYKSQGDFEMALKYYFKALEIRNIVFGMEHPDTAQTYNNIGVVYRNQGDYDKSKKYYLKALEIREKVLGIEHPDTATSYNNIGVVYNIQGDYDTALKYHFKALAIKENVLGIKHFSTATSYINIGEVYKAKGNYDMALKYYYEKALAIVETKLGKNHPYTATTYSNIASVHNDLGNYDKTLEYYEKALKIWLNKDPNHPDAILYFKNFRNCYNATNKETPFEQWLKTRLNEKEWEAYLELKKNLE